MPYTPKIGDRIIVNKNYEDIEIDVRNAKENVIAEVVKQNFAVFRNTGLFLVRYENREYGNNEELYYKFGNIEKGNGYWEVTREFVTAVINREAITIKDFLRK